MERAELSRDGIRVSLKLPIPPAEERDGAPPSHLALTRFVPMQMKRRGVEMRMVLEGDTTPSRVDLPLLKAVARARRWSDDLISGRVQSVDETGEAGRARSPIRAAADSARVLCRRGSSRRSSKAASRRI